MAFQKQKWTLKDFDLLRQLKQSQIYQNRVNWEQIACMINLHSDFKKTPKQCREKYVNFVKVGKFNKQQQEWTQDQLQFLIKLYGQFGNSWCYISSQLRNRSQNSVKNKVNNGLRKFSNLLNKQENKKKELQKKIVSPSLLYSSLQFVNQLQKSIKNLGFNVNYASKFFQFRAEVIRLCIKNQKISQQHRIHLVQLIKELSLRIKSFAIFKMRNKKNWKLSENKIKKICQFDQVIMEEASQLQGRAKSLQNDISEAEKFQLPNSFGDLQKMDIQVRNLTDISEQGILGVRKVNQQEESLQKIIRQIMGQEWCPIQQQQENDFYGF